MKTRLTLGFVGFALVFALQDSTSLGQGSLDPPLGPPQPTMKTLDQVEARTPVDALHTPGNATNTFTINQPGSYYLTSNLVVSANNAIAIITNGVTLDLNGFTISSVASPASGSGIVLSGPAVQDITILNGHIAGGAIYVGGGSYSGAAFVNGITYNSPGLNFPRNLRVSGVSIYGCTGLGINVGRFVSTTVDHCNVRTVGSTGITAGTVNDSVVDQCGGTGISANSAANSSALVVGSQAGISVTTAINCVGVSASGEGLTAESANGCSGTSSGFGSSGNGLHALTANGCYGSCDSGVGYGITADTAIGCRGFSAAGNGINANTASGCYGLTGGPSNYGLYAADNANNCYGQANEGSTGLYAYNAINCYGVNNGPGSGTGLIATDAANSVGWAWGTNSTGLNGFEVHNCYGHTSGGTGYGISGGIGNGTVVFSYGENRLSNFTVGNGPGVNAYIVIGCTGSGTPNISYSYKFLMP